MTVHRTVRRAMLAGAATIAGAVGVVGFAGAAQAATQPPPTTEPPGTPTATSFNGTPTVGTFFEHPAEPSRHSCTASVVWSPRGDVLVTAAHCVTGTFAGVQFAPGWVDGQSPYGRWTVTAAYVDPQWMTSQNPLDDYAFLTVAPQTVNGHLTEIQQVTGANRLGPWTHPGESVTVPAYPAGAQTPITCTNALYDQGPYPAFNCNPYPDGTSGAPFIAHGLFGSSVVGVIGGLYQGGCETWTSYSSPFGPSALATWLRAVVGAPGDDVPAAGSDGCTTGL